MGSIREEIEAIQTKRLIETVNNAYNNVELYRKKFDKIGLKPEHIKSIKDIRLVPFTAKQDYVNIIHMECLQFLWKK